MIDVTERITTVVTDTGEEANLAHDSEDLRELGAGDKEAKEKEAEQLRERLATLENDLGVLLEARDRSEEAMQAAAARLDFKEAAELKQ